jgi:hypothetical protein
MCRNEERVVNPLPILPARINEERSVSFISFGTRDTNFERFLSLYLSIKNHLSRVPPPQVFAEASLGRRNASSGTNSADHTAPRNIFPKLVFHRSSREKKRTISSPVWPVLEVLIIQHTPNKWVLLFLEASLAFEARLLDSRDGASDQRRHMANPFATA